MVKKILLDNFNDIHEFVCKNEAILYFSKEHTYSDYKKLVDDFDNYDFDLYADNTIGDNMFTTFVKDGKIINAYYTSCDKTVRVIVEDGGNLPPREQDNVFEKKVAPLVTQLKTACLTVDCGMCYVIRLCDGRFILIDTAFDEFEEADRLLDVLEEQNTVFEKPVLAACFFTHAHGDHIGVFTRLMKDYADRLVFGDVIFNWPADGITDNVKHDEFDEYVAKTNGIRVITARSGQQYHYADAIIDMLFVCDDLYPDYIANSNDTSLAFSMKINGKHIMWLGDVQVEASKCMCERYDATILKSDVVQVAHHGYWGGSKELYTMINPNVMLWPIPDFWYHEALSWEPNTCFDDLENLDKVYISGRYQTTIDLTKPYPEVPMVCDYKIGDVVYSEYFSDKNRVIDLGWTCLTGGYTECDKSNFELADGGCIWTVSTDRHSILEVLRPEILDNVKSYKLELKGKIIEKPEEFGLIFNHERPTHWSTEHFVSLATDKDKFNVVFIVDAKNNLAKLEEQLFSYMPESRRGLYFVLKKGQIKFESIKLTKL